MSLVIGYYLKLSIYPDWMEKIVSSALMTGTLVIIGALNRHMLEWSSHEASLRCASSVRLSLNDTNTSCRSLPIPFGW